MPQATQVEVMTPGQNERRYLAGAWDVRTGQVHHCLWFRKMAGLFLDLLNLLDCVYPARRFDRIYVVADNYKIHKAVAVQRWLRQHPRFRLLFLPTYWALVHKSGQGQRGLAGVLYRTRCEIGIPSWVMRLITAQAICASLFCAANCRARSVGPMSTL